MSVTRFQAVIAEDHAIVGSGLRVALETPGIIEPVGVAVVAEAADGLRGHPHIAGSFRYLLEKAPAESPLSDHERQVPDLVVAGRSGQEIADIVGISDKTVDRHRTNLTKKLDWHSVAQLNAHVLREGLITPSATP